MKSHGNFKSDDEKGLLEFFLNRPYSLPRKGSLLKAVDAIVSKDNDWKVEERMNWLKEQALLREGRAEAKAEAEAEAKEKALETVRRMVKREYGEQEIAEVLNIPLQKVIQLKNELTLSGTL